MTARRARKVGGSYQAEGTIVADFVTLGGERRLVFEFDEPKGKLHIFSPAQLEIEDGSSQAAAEPTKDEIQAAFETWLERTCPSGDVTEVQRQWEASADCLDLYATPPAPEAA